MMSETAPDAFYGEVTRVRFDPACARLRLCAYHAHSGPAGGPVYELAFVDPEFGPDDAAAWMGSAEVEVHIVAGTSAVFTDYYGSDHTLRARAVTASWQPFDLDDYAGQVRNLEAAHTRTDADLTKARQRLDTVRATALELLRRAELKAAASDTHRKQQAPAIEALKRILFDLE